MNKKLIYLVLALLGFTSCDKVENPTMPNDQQIMVEVADMQPTSTRVHLWNDKKDVIAHSEFTLNAYFDDNNSESYFKDTWVYYFVPDTGAARWRFRDVVNPGNLINFYWPSDEKLNFFAYMPRSADKCAFTLSGLAYNKSNGVQFKASLPTTITDKTEEDREAENDKLEFVYATRLSQDYNASTVNLRFVHPFSAIKFRLHQSHRDLVIHSISLSGVIRENSFSSSTDTYANNGTVWSDQSFLTYTNWTTTAQSTTLKIELEKSVPGDINYKSLIGGPYLTIPQSLNDVKLMVNYTWNGQTLDSAWHSVKTVDVPAWQPGHVYTYTLDLGDNKGEILFKVNIEEWTAGEDAGYENNYEIK